MSAFFLGGGIPATDHIHHEMLSANPERRGPDGNARSSSAAASRLLLSQPAVSRALQRARAMFQDDLLVRSPNGFELTLRGRKILQELEGLLPKMEHLVAPAAFDPAREKSHFRISGPDNVSTVVLPPLCRQYANGLYQ